MVVVMKNISLAFDLDSRKDSKGEKKPPSLGSVPDLPSYTSYCLFPATTVFGPFLTYSEHSKFLHPTPLVSKGNYLCILYAISLFTLDHEVDMEDLIKPNAFSHLPGDVSLHFAIPIY